MLLSLTPYYSILCSSSLLTILSLCVTVGLLQCFPKSRFNPSSIGFVMGSCVLTGDFLYSVGFMGQAISYFFAGRPIHCLIFRSIVSFGYTLMFSGMGVFMYASYLRRKEQPLSGHFLFALVFASYMLATFEMFFTAWTLPNQDEFTVCVETFIEPLWVEAITYSPLFVSFCVVSYFWYRQNEILQNQVLSSGILTSVEHQFIKREATTFHLYVIVYFVCYSFNIVLIFLTPLVNDENAKYTYFWGQYICAALNPLHGTLNCAIFFWYQWFLPLKTNYVLNEQSKLLS
eukprot:Lithocolla_globosa_v1_NODE_1727_length_2377_cov_16.907407.p1 type:complete len:288 gc:universal NODE_1727_length_2377_cov_16.907407:1476-2339(+)